MMNYYSGPYQTITANRSFLQKVFGFMGGALAVTALTAFGIAMNPHIFMRIFSSGLFVMMLFIAQIAAVVALAGFIMRMSTGTAVLTYFLYAISVGVTSSAILMVYTPASVYAAFLVCALMFVTMALYGYVSKSDLSSMGSLAAMGLFGLIIAFIVNMFFHNQAVDYVLSLIGVGIFLVLTAYDMQRIKALGASLAYQPGNETRLAIIGALTLYLDFINLFFMLIRVMGRRQE